MAQGNGGKVGTASNKPTMPFEQILAMFNLTGGTSQLTEDVINDNRSENGKENFIKQDQLGQVGSTSKNLTTSQLSGATSTNSVDIEKNDIKIDDLTIEDWNQLEQILANWINGLQQVQINAKDIPTGNQNSLVEQNTPISTQNQIQQVNQEGGKNLIQWFQTMSRAGNLSDSTNHNGLLNDLSSLPTQAKMNVQLLQHLERLIQNYDNQLAAKGAEDVSIQATPSNIPVPLQSEIPLSGNDKLFGIPKGVQDKLHQLMELEVQAETMVDTKPRLILDKNLVPLLARTDVDKGNVNTESKNVPIPSSVDGKDQPKPNPLNYVGINPFHGNEGTASLQKTAQALPATVSVSQFAPEVSGWASHQIKIFNDMQGTTEAKISLYPQHLGQVEIKITSHQGQISAEIITNTLMGKEVMEGQLNELKQALQQHGLLVQKLDVSYQVPSITDSSSTGFSFSDGNSNPSRDQSSSSSTRGGAGNEKEQPVSEVENADFPYGGPSRRPSASQIDFSA